MPAVAVLRATSLKSYMEVAIAAARSRRLRASECQRLSPLVLAKEGSHKIKQKRHARNLDMGTVTTCVVQKSPRGDEDDGMAIVSTV